MSHRPWGLSECECLGRRGGEERWGRGPVSLLRHRDALKGEGNWFRYGRSDRDSQLSRNLAQEALSAHRGNGGCSNRVREERPARCEHQGTPFPKSESSNRDFWKLLWDVITTGMESRWPGAYLTISNLSLGKATPPCVHFPIVWWTLIMGKH